MSTEIVLPKSQALLELNHKLSLLKEQADSLVIKDQASFIMGAGIKTSLKAVLEAVKLQCGPRLAAAKEELERAKQEEAMLVAPAKLIIETLESKKNAYNEEERRKAAEEERRENEERQARARAQAEADRKERDRLAEIERRKREKEIAEQRAAGEIKAKEAERQRKEAAAAAEREKARAAEDAKAAVESVKPVTVKPNIPTVAGQKNQVFYSAKVIDPMAIIRAYETAKDPVRIAFLRRFITVDEAEVGTFARETKDDEKAAAQLPGVRFTHRG